MTIGTLFKKIAIYVRPYKWLVVGTLVMTLIGSLAAQVNAVVLDRAVDTINELLHNPDLPLGSNGFWKHATKILTLISVILLGKEVLSAVITFAQRYYGEKMRILVSRDLAQAVIEKVLTFKMAFFSQTDNQPGKLQTRIDRGVESLSNTVKNFFIDILPLFTSAIFAIVLMFIANVYVGLVALLIVPIYFWLTYRQALRLGDWRRKMRKYREDKSHGIMNIIESMTVIKSFNRERIEGDKQLALQNALTDNQMQTRKLSYIYDGLKSFVEQIGTVLIIMLTAYLVLSDYPGMSIGKIMYHVMLFANVSAPIRQLHRIYDDMNDALIYAEGFFDILDADNEVESSGTYCQKEGEETALEEGFVMKNVSFSYPNGTKALTDINLNIQKGKITALVGLSGAGKSTVINLLDKFYAPQEGTITFNGVDLNDWDTQALRDNIGLVLQKNHIFDGTIEENILYGNTSATHEQVIDAAKKAYIYDQIMALPNGLQTKATELSGGQQQRIAIARMFIKNPPVIFLDEPTASLDAIATEQIKNSIDAIKKDRTVIIISHSISQIIDADMIYAMQNGKIMQSGNPDEVYHQGGIYKEIFDASARSLNIEKIAQTVSAS